MVDSTTAPEGGMVPAAGAPDDEAPRREPGTGTLELAVLVDVENVSFIVSNGWFDQLLQRVADHGAIRLRRAYGNWSSTNHARHQRFLLDRGFELAHVPRLVGGKDALDIQLAVDAMFLAATRPELGGFVIVTGDSDFLPLFRRLRELGRVVIGAGPASPLARAAAPLCAAYHVYDRQAPGAGVAPAAPGSARAARSPLLQHPTVGGLPDLDAVLAEARAILEADGGTSNLGGLKSRLQARFPGFDERAWGARDMAALLRGRAGLEVYRAEDGGYWVALAGRRPAAGRSGFRPDERAALFTRARVLVAQAGGAMHLGGLKSQLQQGAGFDERRIGFRSFPEFVQACPGLVLGEEDGQLVARLAAAGTPRGEGAGVPLAARYRTLLRKMKWPVDLPGDVIDDAIDFLRGRDAAYPNRELRRRCVEALLPRHGGSVARKAWQAVFRARLLDPVTAGPGDEVGWRWRPGLDRAEALAAIDRALVARLAALVDRGEVPWDAEVAAGLLHGERSAERAQRFYLEAMFDAPWEEE